MQSGFHKLWDWLKLKQIYSMDNGSFFWWGEERKHLTLERQTAPKGIWKTKFNPKSPWKKHLYLPTMFLKVSCCYFHLVSGMWTAIPLPSTVSSLTSYSVTVISQISPSFLSNYSVVILLHFPPEQHVQLYHLHLTSIALELTSFSFSQNMTSSENMLTWILFATTDFLWRTCFAVY